MAPLIGRYGIQLVLSIPATPPTTSHKRKFGPAFGRRHGKKGTANIEELF
jgi:hypothetical protein